MSEKETKKTTTKKPATKKPAAKKTVTKKPVSKKPATKKAQDKPVNTAPYLTKKETDVPRKQSTNYLVPAMFALALGIVLVTTFFDGEFNGLVAGDNPETTVEETTLVANTDQTESNQIPANIETTTNVAIETSEAEVLTAAVPALNDTDVFVSTETPIAQTEETNTTQNALQTVVAPYPYNVHPSWANANNTYMMNQAPPRAFNEMINKQKLAYEQAMQKQQSLMQKVQDIRAEEFERMHKNQQEMQAIMREMNQKSFEIQDEMNQKMKAAYESYHAI